MKTHIAWWRIVDRQPVVFDDAHIAELIRRAQAAGFPTLVTYVEALEDAVIDARWETLP